MHELFKESSQSILVYMATESVIDPFSKEVESVALNSLPINAIVSDLSGESMVWKTGGIITTDSKEIICEKNIKN